MYEDDFDEETSQSDAETARKVMFKETYTLPTGEEANGSRGRKRQQREVKASQCVRNIVYVAFEREAV